jgi:hypothetical protein
VLLKQAHDGSAAADLYVVGVRADRQQGSERLAGCESEH